MLREGVGQRSKIVLTITKKLLCYVIRNLYSLPAGFAADERTNLVINYSAVCTAHNTRARDATASERARGRPRPSASVRPSARPTPPPL